MQSILKKILPYIKSDGTFTESKYDEVHELLDYKFSYGKYIGKRFGDIVVKDYSYCVNWMYLQVIGYNSSKIPLLALYLILVEMNKNKNNKNKTMVQKYRKKPVVIEAIQYTFDNKDEIDQFVGGQLGEYSENNSDKIKDTYLIIPTLEGNMKAEYGDYIIKGVNGEFYPCKPDIFEKTYEKVD